MATTTITLDNFNEAFVKISPTFYGSYFTSFCQAYMDYGASAIQLNFSDLK